MPVDRRAFLRGAVSFPATVRPPGSANIAVFDALCDGCGECASACPARIIRLREHRPEIDFSAGECSACGECAVRCPTGALDAAKPFRTGLAASISARCLGAQGVECRLCGDRCEARAIRFFPVRRGIRLPLVDRDACAGCGACYAACPAAAIDFQRLPETTT